MTAAEKEYEYTLRQTIAELDGWANKGKRMYPIETAMSAVYWLTHAPVGKDFRENRQPESETMDEGLTMNETILRLQAWLADETPNMPEKTAYAALYWLKQVRAVS